MPKTAKTDVQQATIDRNKAIADFIYNFYTHYVGTKPDATCYASGRKILESLMLPTDDNTRIYSDIELTVVCAYLQIKGVALKTLTILHYPHLVMSIVNKQWDLANAVIEKLIASQQSQGIYTEEAIKNMTVPGW